MLVFTNLIFLNLRTADNAFNWVFKKILVCRFPDHFRGYYQVLQNLHISKFYTTLHISQKNPYFWRFNELVANHYAEHYVANHHAGTKHQTDDILRFNGKSLLQYMPVRDGKKQW